MTEWSRAPLGEVARVVGGTTPPTATETNYGGDVTWVTPADLGQLHEPLITSSARKITEAARRTSGLELLPTGTVVMSSRAPIGHLGIASVAVCTNQGCKSFVPGPRLDSWFLYYSLLVQMPRIRALGAGATFAEVSKTDMEGFQISFPPLPEQRRIAATLREQRAVAHGMRESMNQARLHVREVDAAIRRDFFARLPRQAARLDFLIGDPGAIIDGPFGSNLKGDHYESSGIRVIRLGNIGLGTFIDVDRAYVTPAHAARLQRHKADVGDVVIAALGDGARPAGRACLVPDWLHESIVKADCFRVRTSGSALDGAFLMHVMNSPQTLDYVRASTRGATRPRMNLQMLKELNIPVPSLEEQKRIVAELDSRLAEIGRIDLGIRVEEEAIDALPAALLRRAFDEVAA